VTDLKEQHVCIKFCFKLGKNSVETFDMLEVCFREQKMGRTQLFAWFSKFKSDMISVEVAEHLGCLSMSKTDENMDQAKKLVHENRRVTVH
jgi:hypothetical protein